MRGRSRRQRAAIAAVIAISTVWAACYYARYDSLMRTHVELLLAMAEKRRDYAANGRITANPSEFGYPLVRARDFARIVGPRFGDRASFRAFSGFTERYAAFLGTADASGTPAGRLEEALRELRESAAAVVAALDRER